MPLVGGECRRPCLAYGRMVEFRLQPIDNGTRLTITETGFLQFPESKRLEVLRSNKEGWDMQAKNIAEYVKR